MLRFKTLSDEVRGSIVEHMSLVHETANFYCDLYTEKMHRNVYATPKNYLDFIHTYAELHKQKTGDLIKQAARLNVGIVRIDEASVLIQELDKKLEKQRKELGASSFACSFSIQTVRCGSNV